jgi:uncharacterized protein (TIGR04255 family)
MDSRNPYKNAPITEAVIDLRVNPDSTLSLNDLALIQEEIKAEYPGRREAFTVSGQFTFGQRSGAAAVQNLTGYHFVSADEKQISQARFDGFTFSRLKPYESWKSFSAEARRLWQYYKRPRSNTQISRAAVRYINRLDIPLPLNDLKDYLRTYPEISSEISQEMVAYFMQIHIPQPDLKAFVIINEGISNPAVENVVSIILDIDLFREQDLPTEDEALWELLESFRVRKNKLFEASITGKMRELFN